MYSQIPPTPLSFVNPSSLDDWLKLYENFIVRDYYNKKLSGSTEHLSFSSWQEQTFGDRSLPWAVPTADASFHWFLRKNKVLKIPKLGTFSTLLGWAVHK